MKKLTLEQAADFLESASINSSHDFGHAIIHTGTSEAGSRFVIMNNANGETILDESAE